MHGNMNVERIRSSKPKAELNKDKERKLAYRRSLRKIKRSVRFTVEGQD